MFKINQKLKKHLELLTAPGGRIVGNSRSNDHLTPIIHSYIPRTSRSLTQIITKNMIKNKCLSKKKCNYCPLLNKSGKITCHITGEIFDSKTQITCKILTSSTALHAKHAICNISDKQKDPS